MHTQQNINSTEAKDVIKCLYAGNYDYTINIKVNNYEITLLT